MTSPRAVGFFASAALVAFAANSLLCRAALATGEIDAATFTFVRIASGAVLLTLFLRGRSAEEWRPTGDWISAAALFGYAAAFSFAYLRLGAAIGALVLFAVVQVTMIAAGLRGGERPGLRTFLGLLLASGGLVALNLPGASAPDPVGVLLMAAAGGAWGIYSLRGRGATRPLVATAGNFVRAVPFAGLLAAATFRGWQATPRGLLFAAISGALASGVGYALWYAALPGLGATRAAVVQLTVPVIAGLGAVTLLGEPAKPRLLGAGAVILCGVALSVVRPSRQAGSASSSSNR